VATQSDLPIMVQIEEECYPLPWSQQQFVQELKNRVATLLVCEIEQQITGYICYWLIDAEMEILNLATAPAARRKGIAVRLMTEAFSRCSVNKLSAAWLEVRATNRAAIALYRQSGFAPSGIRKGYYQDGEDAIVMVKTFKNQ
jgi:ribosomal-protein-alanine N-acetyltransferase